MSFFKHAQSLASNGFYVFPLIEGKKLPLIKSFTESAVNDSSKVKRFWYDSVLGYEHYHNIGIATSKYKENIGLLVVDVDNKKGKKGHDSLLKLELDGFEFPTTLTQTTPTGGQHLIYKVKDPVKQGVDVLGVGLDIRSRGGYIVGAGSLINGKAYTIDTSDVVWAPQWIIDKCGETTEKRIIETPTHIDQKSTIKRAIHYLKNDAEYAVEGAGGDDTTFKVAARLKDYGVNVDNCLDVMLEHWNEKCQPPWNAPDLEKKIQNAYRHGQNSIGCDSPQSVFDAVKKKESPISILNKEFSFIVMGGKSTIMRHNAIGTVDYMGVQAFHDLKKADTIQTGGGKFMQLSEAWMRSPNRATYDRIELLPLQKTPANVYNLWRGFSCEPIKVDQKPTNEMIEGVELFKEHAFENICDADERLYQWLMGYFAHIIQRPWEKPLTALVFKGQKGVGKNVLMEIIGNLLGSHCLLTSDKRYIIGNFNSHLANLIIMILDEAFWSGDKQAEGKLKDMITGQYHLIEQKGREMFRITNLIRIMILGNEGWLVPAGTDERRFGVFNVGSKRRNDEIFFIRMKELMNQKGANRFLLRYLMDFDLSSVNVNRAPATIGLLEQKLETLNPLHTWIYSSLQEGSFPQLFSDTDWPKEVGKDQFRLAFLAHAKERNIRGWLPGLTVFGRDLLDAMPSIKTRRKGRDANRERVYVFPDLEEARKNFDIFIGHEIKWQDPETNVIDINKAR